MKTIRQLRQERGWTQLELALWLGASANTVSGWERGQFRPNWLYRRRLADLFGLSVEDIAFGPAQQAPQERPQSRHTGPGQAHAPDPY